MARGHIRWFTLLALLLATGLVCSAMLWTSPDAGRSLVATVTAAAALALWPLFAQSSAPGEKANGFAPLAEALLVTTAVLLGAWLAIDVIAALRLAAILLTMLLAVQLLLALGLHPLTLTTTLLLAMSAPAWLAPATAAGGSQSMLAPLSVMLNPLSALASACHCDYLRSDWFYEHSAIGASEFNYPGYPGALLICAAAAGALALLARRSRATPAASVAQR